MNKKALLEYALFARKELETQIALSLNKLGIYKDHITKANVVGDFTIIEGTQETFPKRVYALRNSIVDNELKLRGEKFENVVEEFARAKPAYLPGQQHIVNQQTTMVEEVQGPPPQIPPPIPPPMPPQPIYNQEINQSSSVQEVKRMAHPNSFLFFKH